MGWSRQGYIFKPNGRLDWSQSHAQAPWLEYLRSKNRLAVYYSTRDKHNRTQPAYMELNADIPNQVTYQHINPIMDLGALGTFDSDGVMPSCVVNMDGIKCLFYTGWNRRVDVPYHNSIGLAVSHDDGKTYKKYSEGPLWDRDTNEPLFSSMPTVIVENGRWRMWYLSCTEWRMVNQKPEARYHLKYAESKDGINWDRQSIISVDYQNEEEAGIVRPTVIRDGGIYKMWYSYRNFDDYRTNPENSYRIGYAESADGISWQRLDKKAGLEHSSDAWDNSMTAYPCVLDINGQRLMFYNGNGFGESGFGWAIWTE